MIRLKRAYEAPAPEDGARVLVERLWPRGLTKEQVAAAGTVTLIYAARDEAHNSAAVLKEFLEGETIDPQAGIVRVEMQT